MDKRAEDRSDDAVRVIRRYANRKLYDTTERTFTTIAAVEDLVREGVEIRVVDHATGDDVTEVVIARALGSLLRASGTGVSAVLGSILRAPGEIAKAGAEAVIGTSPEADTADERAHESEPVRKRALTESNPSTPETDSEIGQLRNQVADLTAMVERLLADRTSAEGGDDV